MVDTAVEYSRNHNSDDVNWVEVFQSKHDHEASDAVYRKKREKIRELDRVLQQKERQLKELRSSRDSHRSQDSGAETPSKGSVFITKVKTRTGNNANPPRPTQNFVKKNIEIAEEYKGPGFLTDKLSDRDKYRLAVIEENIDSIEEYNGILPQESVSRLEEIDRALRNYVPQIKWEEMSVGSGQYAHSDSESAKSSKAKKVLPGDPVLREAQERREIVTELQGINSKLLELQGRPFRPLNDSEVQTLLLESGYNLDSLPPPDLRKTQEEILIEEAKESIKKIEDLDKLDFDEVLEIALEAETALLKYQKLAEIEDKELETDPEFLRLKSSLQDTLRKCDENQKECANVLDKLEVLEKKLGRQQEEVEQEEDIEKVLLSEVKVPDVKLQSIEEIDQEIESKIEFEQKNEAFFPDMDEITPENYPTLYYMYERVLQQEGAEKIIDSEIE